MVWVFFLLKSGRGQRVNIFVLNPCLEEAEKWKMGCKCLFLFPFKKPNFVILPALKVCLFFEGRGRGANRSVWPTSSKDPEGCYFLFSTSLKAVDAQEQSPRVGRGCGVTPLGNFGSGTTSIGSPRLSSLTFLIWEQEGEESVGLICDSQFLRTWPTNRATVLYLPSWSLRFIFDCLTVTDFTFSLPCPLLRCPLPGNDSVLIPKEYWIAPLN